MRKLYSLVYSLPHNSATWAFLNGDDRRWDDGTHLLANCQDVLGMIYRISWVGHQLKGKPPKFDPVDRPGQEIATAAEMMDPVAVSFLDMFSPERAGKSEVSPELLARMLAGPDKTEHR